MALISSSYFIGERLIPNATEADITALIDNLILAHENDYMVKAMGYELFSLFNAGIQGPTPDQRYLDILLGLDFTGQNGRLKRWTGLISLSSSSLATFVNPSALNDFSFVVGTEPIDGAISYVNATLSGKTYKVTQRGFGPLEPLKSDNSNILTADIRIDAGGGFTWLNGIKFSLNDKYFISGLFDPIDISTLPLEFNPASPIADYVYYYWLKFNHTQTSGLGEVRSDAQNAVRVSPKHKAVKAWNDMVDKTWLLYEFLKVNAATYPEFQDHLNDCEVQYLLTKINPFF